MRCVTGWSSYVWSFPRQTTTFGDSSCSRSGVIPAGTGCSAGPPTPPGHVGSYTPGWTRPPPGSGTIRRARVVADGKADPARPAVESSSSPVPVHFWGSCPHRRRSTPGVGVISSEWPAPWICTSSACGNQPSTSSRTSANHGPLSVLPTYSTGHPIRPASAGPELPVQQRRNVPIEEGRRIPLDLRNRTREPALDQPAPVAPYQEPHKSPRVRRPHRDRAECEQAARWRHETLARAGCAAVVARTP
jgi:hypothetical protein